MQNTSTKPSENTEDKLKSTPEVVSKDTKTDGKGPKHKKKNAYEKKPDTAVKVVAKYSVHENIVFQNQRVSIKGEGDFHKDVLVTNLDIPREYKHVVNQAFKLASILNQKGTKQEQVNESIQRLQKLIAISGKDIVYKTMP